MSSRHNQPRSLPLTGVPETPQHPHPLPFSCPQHSPSSPLTPAQGYPEFPIASPSCPTPSGPAHNAGGAGKGVRGVRGARILGIAGSVRIPERAVPGAHWRQLRGRAPCPAPSRGSRDLENDTPCSQKGFTDGIIVSKTRALTPAYKTFNLLNDRRYK